jgi:hypothetical protein
MANADKNLAGASALYLYGISRKAAPDSAGTNGARKSSARPASKSAKTKSAPKAPRSQPPLKKIGSAGIDGAHPVEPLVCAEFICWVCKVDESNFAHAIERNMENLEWLALHGVRHQQVVGEIAAQTSMVPARFGTIFSGEPALIKDVQGRKAALNKVFDHVTGADEWGVKVFGEYSAPAPPVTEARTGKEYLQQKAARIRKRPEHNDQELSELATALEKIATDSAPSGKVSGAQPNLLWQATFLVPRAQRKQWDQTLQNFVERWEGQRRIEINGPWPPYSFVSDAD